MLMWLMNLGFAGSGATIPTDRLTVTPIPAPRRITPMVQQKTVVPQPPERTVKPNR